MKQAIERILFATDFSDSSKQAQRRAMSLAIPLRAEVHALHVAIDPAPLPSITGVEEKPVETQLKQTVALAEKLLETQMASDRERCAKLICEVRVGDPAREIKNYADQHDIDLIVLGTNGRTGLTHALLGSVAEKVIHSAACPVVAVPLQRQSH